MSDDISIIIDIVFNLVHISQEVSDPIGAQ